ncbi:putative lipoyltransferase 2, mitochondrial [Smittium culicis]|uniref:lipoyl(octanoyl) transferase n=1 Tax=Smittium culicis TaxID=133412 RepID=A0A1R1YD06_9FUNG|nr:putative lipoyltransferase 2, mitochondrial [Smittium culicis]
MGIESRKLTKISGYENSTKIEGDNFFNDQNNAGVLLLLEPESVYTNGRRNHGQLTQVEQVAFRDIGAKYYEVKRGGELTYHGPGQLVAYPIIDLKRLKLGVHDFVSKLEASVVSTCESYGIKTFVDNRYPGVWATETKKIAATGTHIQRFISSHGIALNCQTDLNMFRSIVPCGLVGKTATSLEAEYSLESKASIPTPSLSECIDGEATISYPNNARNQAESIFDPFFVSRTLIQSISKSFDANCVPLGLISPIMEEYIQSYMKNKNEVNST